MDRLLAEDRIVFGKDHTETAQLRRYLRDAGDALRSVITVPGRLGADRLAELLPKATEKFPHPKPVELIELLVGAAGDFDALVLDPFAGSGTTADGVLRLNKEDGGTRRFILIEEGEPGDPFCRTLTAARIKAVIEKEHTISGFSFEITGRKLDREAILELEREAITNLIVQTDPSGVGRGIQKVPGTYVIGFNMRREAICLCWNGRANSTVTRDVLRAMYLEAKALELRTPLRVYGSTCDVAETDTFRFCQIPDAILIALQLAEEAEESNAEQVTTAVQTLEAEVLAARSRISQVENESGE